MLSVYRIHRRDHSATTPTPTMSGAIGTAGVTSRSTVMSLGRGASEHVEEWAVFRQTVNRQSNRTLPQALQGVRKLSGRQFQLRDFRFYWR